MEVIGHHMQRFEIVGSAGSLSGVWREVTKYYKAEGFGEQRRLTREFNTIKMEPGEDLEKYILRVDRNAKELERLGAVNITIIIFGKSSEYRHHPWATSQLRRGGADARKESP